MNKTASTNMRIGPMTQFCTSDNPSTFQLRNTSPSSSYFTFASGGYIIRMRPSAMGMLVVSSSLKLSINDATLGATRPNATPAAIARKIQTVR